MSGEPALLCLADGTRFEGVAFGASGTAVGEVVFTTCMTGYQEVLTDPSYAGQLVTMTAPHIGNTGCNRDDDESRAPALAGFIVRAECASASSWRADESLHAFLTRHGVVALGEVDTRRLTRHLRDHGAQNGAMGTADAATLSRLAQQAPSMQGQDLVARVTPPEPYSFEQGSGRWRATAATERQGVGHHVVVMDMGVKRNILRCLVDQGCRVTAVPARSGAAEIGSLRPDGILVSNGPGDPAAVRYAIETLATLLGRYPIFGICLGHQLLALAAGGTTYKLPFGHHGANHPVSEIASGRVLITSQNHGFAVDVSSLGTRARATHVHLNDGTSEGLAFDEAGACSVQFHPEAAGGPHDAMGLLATFVARLDAARG